MVQDRESLEGPITRLGSRLCMLLSISPLAAGIVIEEEEKGQLHPENISGDDKDRKVIGARRAALETSIQILGQFESLLVAPTVAVTAANLVAAKVSAFVSPGGQNMGADINSFGKSSALSIYAVWVWCYWMLLYAR
jgi:hypothetical protein